MTARKHVRAWAQLRLLCCSGVPVMSVVPEVCAIARELMPESVGALFLTDGQGVPHAFFHEDSPPSVQALFRSEPQLFQGDGEYNVFRLVGDVGAPKLGQLLAPPPEYFASNTYQLLVRGSGHHHALDARLEPDGQRSGLLSVFRPPGRGFDRQDLSHLQRIALHVEHALRVGVMPDEASSAAHWTCEAEAMLVANAAGRVVFASSEAQALLESLPLCGAVWPDRRRMPALGSALLERLHDAEQHPGSLPYARWPVPGGVLVAHAQWLGLQGQAPSPACLDVGDGRAADGLVGIVLKRLVPDPLRVWRALTATKLPPQALEAAYWLALLGQRDKVRERMALSESMMKDCLKAVYAEFGVSSVAEVAQVLRTPRALAA
ncbi:hypothetical protein [uncultured Azohydromonas sp.]|jgi:hypothetical protein|uniref:hypothetical protein n=1 Tax=uncultured Azohydromonas sp. TaxID=487342 RepID=UPI0026035609|nr:hypothetical protein [uncultured Azohydromonas sp.]